MRLAGYVRDSTREQAEHGFGLDGQERGIRKWAKANGHRLGSQYTLTRACPAATASRIASACLWHSRQCATARPKGSLWLALIALLARSQCRKRVGRLGGNPFNADSGGVLPDDPDNPMRTAMRQMVGVFAELERRMVVKRLRDGRRWKAELDGFAYGSPTLGQRAEDDELVTDEDESVTLARIREL